MSISEAESIREEGVAGIWANYYSKESDSSGFETDSVPKTQRREE